MPISQSVLDGLATSMVTAMLPKNSLELTMSQTMAIQAKAGGVAIAGEKGVELVQLAVAARAASDSWALDDPLKVAMEEMLVSLFGSTSEVGKQAAGMRMPK